MTQGTAPPVLTATINGFVNGDTAATSLVGKPALTTTATASSPAGSVAIVVGPGTLASSNYDFLNLVAGTLTINAAPPAHWPSVPFVIGADGQADTRSLDASGNPTGAFSPIAPGQVKGLAVIRLGNTANFEAFAIDPNNQVEAATIVGGARSPYFTTAYGAIASIAAGTAANGNPLLFAIGTDSQLYEQTFNAAGQPTAASYTKAAYGNFASAVVTHDAAGNPLLYAVGADGQVYGLKLTASGAPKGGLFKMAPGGVTQLAVQATASGAPEVFVIGLDRYVYALKADSTGSPAGGYFGGIGGPVESITVGSATSGNPLLFAIGTDGQVYGHKFDATGTPTGTFYGTAIGSASSIAASVGSNGSLEVFAVLSTDSQVYAEPFDPTGEPTGVFTLTTAGTVKKVVVV